jgi:hypothetical protein
MLTSWAALRSGQLSKPLNLLGLAIGTAGIVSSLAPALNEMGYAFGVGVIVWWSWLGIVLLQNSRTASSQPLNLAIEGKGLA